MPCPSCEGSALHKQYLAAPCNSYYVILHNTLQIFQNDVQVYYVLETLKRLVATPLTLVSQLIGFLKESEAKRQVGLKTEKSANLSICGLRFLVLSIFIGPTIK